MKVKKNICGKEDGFLVQAVFLIFYVLERCSVFYWVRVLGSWSYEKRNISGKAFVNSYIFPEIWVVGNICGAILFQHLAPYISCEWVLILMIAYAIERVLEMFVYQVNVLFFHRLIPVFIEPDKKKSKGSRAQDTRKQEKVKSDDKPGTEQEYKIKSSTRTVLMLILNMVEYVLQFAVIYAAMNRLCGSPQAAVNVMGSFRIFMNMTSPEEFSGNFILSVGYMETVIGMFMNIVCLARFVGMLPEVKEIGIKSKDGSENQKTN